MDGVEENGGEQENTEGKPAMVPSARLREESALKRAAVADAKEARAALTAAQKQLETLQADAKRWQDEAKGWEAKHADVNKSWETKFGDLEKSSKSAAESWEDERAVYRIGINDPEAIGIAKHLYNQLPADKRPAFPEWMTGHKAKPEDAPKALRAYLQTETPAKQAKSPGQTKAGGAAPPTSPAAAAHGGQFSKEYVDAVIEECKTTGDWSKFLEVRGAMHAHAAKSRH